MTYNQLAEYISNMTEAQREMPVVVLINSEYYEPNCAVVVDFRVDPEIGYGEDQTILM